MILINNPQIFIDLIESVFIKYEHDTNEKLSILNYENTFLLAIYGESINEKIVSAVQGKENFVKKPFENVVSILRDKYKDKTKTNGFVEADAKNEIQGIEEFVVLNKSMFYISSWLNKCSNEIELYSNFLSDDELLIVEKKRNIFTNILFEKILDISSDKTKYGSIQFRVQDTFFLYSNINQENLNILLDLREKVLQNKVSKKTLIVNWINKLSSETNHGVDWKILNNTLKNIQGILFTSHRINGVLTVKENISNKKDVDIKLIFSKLNNVLDNIEVTLYKWRRYKGLLDYQIYEQVKSEILLDIVKFKKNKDILDDKISLEFRKIIDRLNDVLVPRSFKPNENKIVINISIEEAFHSLDVYDNNIINNAMLITEKIIKGHLFSKEDNPYALIYNYKYDVIYNKKEKTEIKSLLFSFEYMDEIGEYLIKKLEFEGFKLIMNIATVAISYDNENSQDDYHRIFSNFMKKCDEIKLENKLIEQTRKNFNENRINNKKKI